MTKSELIKTVSKKTGITQADAEATIDAILDSITEALKGGEEHVALSGFGTFSVVSKAPRKGRNPKTGQEIIIPASKTARFKAGKKLKSELKGVS